MKAKHSHSSHHSHHKAHSHVSNWYQYFGLWDHKGKTPLPLKKIAVNAKINDYIAEVSYFQIYSNPHTTRLETEYFFPISNNACFHKFQAKFGATTLEGVVKAKEEARQEYDKHNKEGNTVAYAEVADDNYSVLCVKIGNIPPSTEIEIVFSYIERLEISLNKFWRFSLYSSLVSKSAHELFTSATMPALESAKNSSLADYPHAKHGTDHLGPQWEVSIQVDSRSPITFIKSPSHEVEITQSQLSSVFSANVTLSKSKAYTPHKDFVLLYATDSIHKPSYLLSPFEEGYCTLINFFPEISYMSFDDAYMASLEGKDPLEKMIESAKNEFVFLIDKNATLDRESAKLIIETLKVFLESLPSDSYCRVMLIGDQETADQSVKASKEVSDSFLHKVRSAMPTDGKSKIVEAFEAVGRTDIIPGYFRLVFLLTNGQIDTSASEVTQTIREKLFKTRVFVLGIGDASVTDFTKKAALEGYGTYEVVRESEEIPEKVTHLLKTAIAPFFTDFELKIENESLFSYVVPLPKVIGCISPNELVEFFVVFNKKLDTAKKTTFTLKFYNGFNQRVEQFNQDIDVECADLSEAVVKLGMLKFCESLVKKKEIYEAMGDGEIVKSFKEDVQKSLVKTSLRHGILTSETAFVCLVKEGDDIIRQIPSEKITMPSRLGHDHREDGEEMVNVVSLDRVRHEEKKNSGYYRPHPQIEIEESAAAREIVVQQNTLPNAAVNIDVPSALEARTEYRMEYSFTELKRAPEPILEIIEIVTPPKTTKDKLLEKISETAGSKTRAKKSDFWSSVAKGSLTNYTRSAKPITSGRSSGPKINVRQPLSTKSTNKKILFSPRSPAGENVLSINLRKTVMPKSSTQQTYSGSASAERNLSMNKSVTVRHSSPGTKFENKSYIQPTNNSVLVKATAQKPSVVNVKNMNKKPKMSSEEKPINKTTLKSILTPKSSKEVSKVLFVKLSQSPSTKDITQRQIKSASNSETKRRTTPATKLNAIELETISKTSQYLVELQKGKGYWEPQVVIGNLLRYNLAGLMKRIPEELQAIQDREKVWLTILILTWIQHYGLNKDKWETASKKAMSWLENNGGKYENHIMSAKLAFGF